MSIENEFKDLIESGVFEAMNIDGQNETASREDEELNGYDYDSRFEEDGFHLGEIPNDEGFDSMDDYARNGGIDFG